MILEKPRLKKRTRIINGRTYHDWQASCGCLRGRRVLFFAKDADEARKKGEDFIRAYLVSGGPLHACLRRHQIIDALNALELLAANGLKMSLSEVVLKVLAAKEERLPAAAELTLGELMSKFLVQIDPVRTRSRSSYKSVMRRVTAEIKPETPVAALTPGDFSRFLERYTCPTTANAVLKRLKAVMNWGVAQKLTLRSPVAEIPYRLVVYKEPAFFPPERVEAIMRVVKESNPPDGIGMFFVLGFYAGLRTAEILRAEWEDINLDEGFLRVPVPKGITNGGRPRIVELEPLAVQWMRFFSAGEDGAVRSGRIVASAWKVTDWKRRHLQPLGLSWGNDAYHNVMRHTYATMHVAAFRNAASTALNLGHGHSSEILEKHYRGLARRLDGARYWSTAERHAVQP